MSAESLTYVLVEFRMVLKLRHRCPLLSKRITEVEWLRRKQE